MTQSNQWEERLRQKLMKLGIEIKGGMEDNIEDIDYDKLVDFIRQHQNTLLKEIRDEIEKKKYRQEIIGNDNELEIYNDALQDAIHIVDNKLNE